MFEFGIMDNLNYEVPAIYEDKDWFKHFYILGKTGVGKTSLMEQMALYNLERGWSVIYIDPKGDSANKLYNYTKDKYKVKFTSFNDPIKINPLAKVGYNLGEIIKETEQILNIAVKSTSPNIDLTAKMKSIMNYSIKALDSDSSMTMGDLYKFLFDKAARDNYLLSAPKEIRDWWKVRNDVKTLGVKEWGDFISTMQSVAVRLGLFLDDSNMREFLTGRNEFYVEDLVENGESIFINAFTSDPDNKILLANLFVYAVYSYIHKEVNKKPLIVYVDEFSMVASDLFADMLPFSRSFKVGFVLGQTHFSGIDKTLLETIFGVINTFVIFNCGDTEASRFAPMLDVSSKEIMKTRDYSCFVKIGNRISKVDTLDPLDADSSYPMKAKSFLGDEWCII